MRLCLDQLKSARHRRETYVGPWLPDPIFDAEESGLDDITLPLMLALDVTRNPEKLRHLRARFNQP
jgi:RNA polymerase sigma-70 factor (ECF subfamily)